MSPRSALEQSRNWHAQARERQNDRYGRQHRDDAQNQVIFGPFAGHECPFPPGRGHDSTGAHSPEAAGRLTARRKMRLGQLVPPQPISSRKGRWDPRIGGVEATKTRVPGALVLKSDARQTYLSIVGSNTVREVKRAKAQASRPSA